MDKLLAFSIMSSSPAYITGAGHAARLSWHSGGKNQLPGKEPAKQEETKVEQSSRPDGKREAKPVRFAPEFDGLNCFDSIVSF